MVAPLVGAWIEIQKGGRIPLVVLVAPLAGAWIEILILGLLSGFATVAPLAGAWIEIVNRSGSKLDDVRRSPRGSVD